ncbi:MAG: DNA sulfur modification protein DndD [Candidatus Nitrosotenuis sp.]
MQLTRIILENYGVFRDRNTIDLTTSKDKPIILFGGKNGSGKTSIFEAIILCLYGNAFSEIKFSKREYEQFLARKIHKFADAIQSNDFASITVEFQYFHQGQVDNYTVNRRWIYSDGKIIEELIIKKNNKELDSIEESNWQAFVKELIPPGVSRLFFFDGEKIQELAEKDAGNMHIMTSFNSLLGLDVVDQLQSDLKIHILRRTKDRMSEVEEKLDTIETEKREVEKNIESLSDKRAELQTEIDQTNAKIETLEDKIAKLGGGFASQRVTLKEKRDRLQKELSEIEENIRILCSGLLPFCLIPNERRLLKKQLLEDQEILKKQFEKEIVEKKVDEFKNKISSKTFWSDFKLSAFLQDQIKEKMFKTLDSTIPSENTSIGVINFSTLETNRILNQIEEIENAIPTKLEELTSKFDKITDLLQKIETALENAPSDDVIGPLVSELNSHHQNLGSLKNEMEHIEQQLSTAYAELGVIKIRIRKYLDEQATNEKFNENVELSNKIQKALEDYASQLKIKKLDLLEEYLLKSLNMLFHKTSFIEKVSVDEETFSITLYKKNGDIIPKDILSKGEKQMFAIAVLWALAKTSGKPLPFIIDTPLARLDSEHRENLVTKFFPVAGHQVLIFSTDTEIDQKYFAELSRNISKAYHLIFDSQKGRTAVTEGYFWNKKEAKVAPQ